MLHLDLVQTVAFAGLALFVGYGMCRVVPLFAQYNLPPAVIVGLSVAAILALLRRWDITPLTFDVTLQKPLLSAFFTAIGFRVSGALLRRGGSAVLMLLLLSTIGAVIQNILGIGMAALLGQPPLFGVLCGSVTLTGGPATGLAFAPQFKSAGVPAAEEVAVVAAIFGIVAAGLIGAPIATILIERLRHRDARLSAALRKDVDGETESRAPNESKLVEVEGVVGTYEMHKSVAVLLFAVWIGSWISAWLTAHVMTLPIYMGGMLIAAFIRNIDDITGCVALSQRALDVIGSVALSFFLVMALMTLDLWKLADIALPMISILSLQIVVMIVYSIWPVFAYMGHDYDAAVTSGGFFGFMIGITANAIASMDSVVNRYGPAPVAYLVVPLVGAFFIDFTNALLIQTCLNLFVK